MTGTELATRSVDAAAGTGVVLAEMTPASPWMMRIEEHSSWEVLSQLRVSLRAVVALNRFRVRDLLALKEGQIFESLSQDTEDVLFLAGQVQLGWAEFEVVEQRIAIRLTRLK